MTAGAKSIDSMYIIVSDHHYLEQSDQYLLSKNSVLLSGKYISTSSTTTNLGSMLTKLIRLSVTKRNYSPSISYLKVLYYGVDIWLSHIEDT